MVFTEINQVQAALSKQKAIGYLQQTIGSVKWGGGNKTSKIELRFI